MSGKDERPLEKYDPVGYALPLKGESERETAARDAAVRYTANRGIPFRSVAEGDDGDWVWETYQEAMTEFERVIVNALLYDPEPELVADGGEKVGSGTNRSVSEEILDATCGGRSIWHDNHKEHNNALYIDKREREPGFHGHEGRTYGIDPDEVQDFRDLPYADQSFNLVVFDPPHVIRDGGMEDLAGQVQKKYGALHAETWQHDLRQGFEELWRVLTPGGTLVFKFADRAADFDEVLNVLPRDPLFGTVSRVCKTAENRWFVFYKPAGGE